MRLRQRVREYAYAMGFGIDEAAEQRVLDGGAHVPPGSLVEGKLMAVQVAKNKFTPDTDIEAVKRDYVYCVEALAKYADIIVVNVSSPNTPGLRGLQSVEPLTNILKGVVDAARKAEKKTKPAVMVKVSPDEDSDDQVSGICEAIWVSGVDGVIVGNTTKRRPEPLPRGYTLSEKEAGFLLEEGGYSGPQLFERTLDLVKRYRRFLDQGPPGEPEAPEKPMERSQATAESDEVTRSEEMVDVAKKIEDTVRRDKANLKEPSAQNDDSSRTQPLIRLPERHNPSPSSKTTPSAESPALSASTHLDQLPSLNKTSTSSSAVAESSRPRDQSKVIFATGGITNGRRALEVLNAGASVAMVYTALVYGGVGTISRIKGEMREEMTRH